jgi:hypothetical protein
MASTQQETLRAPASPTDGRAAVDAALAAAASKLARLAQLDPLLIDVSLREPCFASPLGHTLQDKLALLSLAEEFGIQDRIVATLDYQYPDQVQVEDQFCLHLRNTGYDFRRSFAASSLGAFTGGSFVPHVSMVKLVEYTIPNTLHEFVLLPDAGPRPSLAAIAGSIAWLRQNLPAVDGAPGRIYVNVLDLVDAFLVDPDWACEVLTLLAQSPVDGISFEDDRGTFFPFQVGATVSAAKALLRPDQLVLFHAHTGNGMENASVIEALLNGASGYWGGLTRTSSTIGHASLADLIANLMRAGNPRMNARYRVERLLPVCDAMHRINIGEPAPDDWPITGHNAYREVLSDFRQRAGRPNDLPPQSIGGTYQFRIAPVGSDVPVVAGRVKEALGIDIGPDVAQRMILLMRSDLLGGVRIHYDEPPQLRELYLRALHP